MWFWPKRNKHAAKSRVKPAASRNSKPHRRTAEDELTREVAGLATDLSDPLGKYLGVLPNRDPLMLQQAPNEFYRYPYGLFEEALDKDAHLSALIAQRKSAVLAWERQLDPADCSSKSHHVAILVEAALAGITRDGHENGDGFEQDLGELLDAVPYGLAISEVLWERRPLPGLAGLSTGETQPSYLLPKALLSRHPRRFIFGVDGRLRLLSASDPVKGEPVPDRKFLVFAPYGRHENPYGCPVLRSVWWMAYFKRQAFKFWVMFCERFGTPTTILKHPLSATDQEKRAYRRIMRGIQQETGLVVPEGVELALLEAQRSGTVQTYSDLVELCNREMSKALIGQTLTLEPGDRGARSLGEVHLAVRQDIVRQDAQALEALVNGQLIRWIVDLNLAPSQRKYPRWRLVPPQGADLALQLDIDEFFAAQDLPVDTTELYARYGRSQPKAENAEQNSAVAEVSSHGG
jgi:phage gp29-like protein